LYVDHFKALRIPNIGRRRPFSYGIKLGEAALLPFPLLYKQFKTDVRETPSEGRYYYVLEWDYRAKTPYKGLYGDNY